ncbi:hypothetical protein P389DRAFT_212801 [Cystobasidium minutum MCA 4210]|uniref:uncharacterized protein n=1 Tax=Cystobasidium minutum MCA 4210 TaxID=1397322 RepID=UPI0034CED7D3|eukprot:jgi/Rhomi1/212801/estExt_Genemark1.C_70329
MAALMPAWPTPEGGASLLLAFTPPQEASTSTATTLSASSTIPARRTALILGSGRLASVRSFACLEAGLNVALIPCSSKIHDPELDYRISSGQIALLDSSSPFEQDSENEQAYTACIRESIPQDILDDILLVCITDTISSAASTRIAPRSPASALALRKAFFKLRIPVNVADYPALSDFHFPATHRFPLSSSSSAGESSASTARSASPLQIAITTNGNSCRLASRLRREIVSKLPKGVGSAVARIGQLRQQAKQIDRQEQASRSGSAWSLDSLEDIEQGEREEGWSSTLLNKPVPQILAGAAKTTVPAASQSKCTSSNRILKKNPPQLDFASLKPLHPSQMPLTPPATPPLRALAQADNIDSVLAAGDAAKEIVPPSLTRMRFIAQISEYWPIDKLANMTEDEGKRVISLYAKDKASTSAQDSQAASDSPSSTTLATAGSSSIAGQDVIRSSLASDSASSSAPTNGGDIAPRHALALDRPVQEVSDKKGKIFLLGSGPGSPALLTMAAHTLLTKHATLILSDKLVPSEILALIPPSIPLVIAKKFPGNAEGAQNELMDLAYQGALKGETVVRLKQGDPYVYGRGGEEVLFFRERGFEAVVVPGISSAFAAPLMAGIPVTQRGVSESVTVTTGVGRKGKGVKLPGYERSRTLTVLMGVARLEGVVNALISEDGTEGNGREGGGRQGAAYPPYCPIAIIEKASSPDQRLVASTLEGIVSAMERVGEQRPPGMMIIGWSVLALEGKGDVEVLDGVEGLSSEELENIDRQRVDRWLAGKGSIVREGLDASWSDLVALQGDQSVVQV